MFDWFVNNLELVVIIESENLVIGFRRRGKAKSVHFFQNGKEISMLQMTYTQKAPVSLVIKDAKGKPARVDGIPEWSSSDDAVATVEDVAADGMSATIVGKDTGVCQVNVSADADLGTGVKPINGFLDVNINPGEAVTVELQAGTPVEQ